MQEQTTQTTPQIAVIVPVYNPGQYLPACVDSILAQTYRDYECILVDDGSTDGSGKVCDDYAARDARIKVIHKTNAGLMSAWMRGVEESTAPYLFFIDSDDWVDDDALERLAQGLTMPAHDDHDHMTVALQHADTVPATQLADRAGNSADAACRQIICAGCMIEREWNHTSVPEGNAAPAGVYEGERLQSEIKNRILGNEYRRILPSRCMKLTDRRLIEDNLHYCDPTIRMGEDLNIMVPALLDADRVVLLEDAYIYHYRYVAESMVHGYDAGLYDNVKRLIAVMRKVLTDKAVPDAETMADREFVYLFLLILKNEIRRTDVTEEEVPQRIGASEDAVTRRIVDLCNKEHSQELLKIVGGRNALRNGANRLLARIMERPSGIQVWFVRRIFLFKG